jgi:hypothetical protein
MSIIKLLKSLENLSKGKNGFWDKEGYTLHVNQKDKDFLEIGAKDKHGNEAGIYRFSPTRGMLDPLWSFTHSAHQRKGLANAAYSMAEKHMGMKIRPSEVQTTSAEKFHAQPNKPFGNDLGKAEPLEKDVGRVTFPNLDAKMTRPDQEVKRVISPKAFAKTATQKLNHFFGDQLAPHELPYHEASFRELGQTMTDKPNQGFALRAGDGDTLKPLNAGMSPGADKWVAEHEGFHHLINAISSKHNLHLDDVYSKLNNNLSQSTRDLLAIALQKHRGYTPENNHHELVTSLRDALVHKDWRDRVLESLPEAQRQAAHTRMKVDFAKVRDFGANLNLTDFKDQIRKSVENSLAKSKIKVVVQSLSKNIESESPSREYEVPYGAGYSKDGTHLYIDKRLPRVMTLKDGRTVSIDKYLKVHEQVEKQLIDSGKYGYKYSHEYATSAERRAVKEDKIDWNEYQNFVLGHIKKLSDIDAQVPKDIDLKPERDYNDKATIKDAKQHGAEDLAKDAGRITMPKINPKWTRPDQQVVNQPNSKPQTNPDAKLPRANPGSVAKKITQDEHRAKYFTEPTEFDEFSGQYFPDSKIGMVGNKNSLATKEHEAHHVLVGRLVDKHGVDKIHNFYDNLIKKIHPAVSETLHKLLRGVDNYRNQEHSTDKRTNLTHKEEVINLLRDMTTGYKDEGKQNPHNDNRRNLINTIHTTNPEYFKSIGFNSPQEFDNEVKRSWKTVRDTANNIQLKDLR